LKVKVKLLGKGREWWWIWSKCVLAFIFFKKGSHYATQAGLELKVHLSAEFTGVIVIPSMKHIICMYEMVTVKSIVWYN
jgi:hypothetical protein